MATLAYYAHYYGSGHCRYADFAASVVPNGIPVFSSRDFDFRYANPVIRIPDEEFDHALREHHLITLPNYLHYSPVGVDKVRQRSLQILQTVEELDVELVIVDISVEVAALLRASSVPYLYVRLFGDRRDVAHEEAFRGAMGLIAYFPEALESESTPDWVRKKTVYIGFKPSPTKPSQLAEEPNLPADAILFVRGFGAAEELEGALARVQRIFPERPLIGIGDFSPMATALLDWSLGVVQDITPYLRQASVVVAACGSNLTAEVLRAGKPFVPVPCQRPYREQVEIAEALYRAGLCVSLEDFLAGATPPVPYFARVAEERYAAYFGGLAATDDWRTYLGVELKYVPIPGHSL
ncbi:hypothetical protein [Neolewinella antarctica]|uniref:Glycosyltransferase n=1 Tax=Neolewinella antarctica TaxID=442734 RepID=A0ABX0XBK2_9BACT|nr:hypothetical protein [Neolewinella antarctica]NJC26635.1 hypothetical protein [Neolewinella antarctica]